MQSLFDSETHISIIERIHKLTPNTQKQWGKMQVAQMLAHCKEAFKVPLSEEPMPRLFLGLLIAWVFKSKLYNDQPWKKNLPTAPDFIIRDERDFTKEKQELIGLVDEFYKKGSAEVGKYPHPMFGAFTPDQWGRSMYKHLDHHLQQFGV